MFVGFANQETEFDRSGVCSEVPPDPKNNPLCVILSALRPVVIRTRATLPLRTRSLGSPRC
jgi:hypothetical protein